MGRCGLARFASPQHDVAAAEGDHVERSHGRNFGLVEWCANHVPALEGVEAIGLTTQAATHEAKGAFARLGCLGQDGLVGLWHVGLDACDLLFNCFHLLSFGLIAVQPST